MCYTLLLMGGVLGGIVYLRIFTELAIPGWASLLFAVVLNVAITVSVFAFLLLLQQLNRRSHRPEPPVAFYRSLILSTEYYGTAYG